MSDDASTGLSPTLRRIAQTIEWPLPSGEMLTAGGRVRDRKHPHQTGTVLAALDTPARDFYLESIDCTVADDNPGYLGSDPVVAVVWGALDTLAGRVVDLDEWDAAVHYAQDHLPSVDEVTTRQTVRVLVEHWVIVSRRFPLLESAGTVWFSASSQWMPHQYNLTAVGRW